MGLVVCVDCGESVSDRAANCPRCGGPIGGRALEVRVRFLLTNKQLINNCAVMAGGATLCKCRMGETAVFTIDGPTEIKVKMAGGFNQPTITARPGDRFEVGSRAFGKIFISQVDVL